MPQRCHAGSCTDPQGGPEPTADLGGMSAHPDCAAYEEALSAALAPGAAPDALDALCAMDGQRGAA